MAIEIQFIPYAPGTTDAELQRISSVDPRLSRTNYFDGRLLKASDLTRDQVYLDERLLEVGQVLGNGIVSGLELSLQDGHRLLLGPGIAVAPSGRVLELADRDLEIDLLDAALIATRNKGRHRRLRRGLYAVVLQAADVCSDSAEAYPVDLAGERGIRCNSFSEGVELTLKALELPLPQSDPIGARAALVRELIAAAESPAVLPEQGVPLGLLAVENGRPLWLDHGLIRRPLRHPGAPGALQRDLAVHYEELLTDILAARNESGLNGGFAASQYFRLLPPFGSIPKDALDPVEGRQGYFPSGYEVSIAPVRRDDLSAILRETAALAPMDLEVDRDADIMVLVPLSDTEFGWRARQLERGQSIPKDRFGLGRLLHIDRLALRLYPSPTPHRIDTDAASWRSIWQEAHDGEIRFVRRPPRTAETNVSAVVLARGFDLPLPTPGGTQDLEDLETQIDTAYEDRDSAIAAADELRARLAALEGQEPDERIAALRDEILELQARLAGMEDSSRALADAQARIAELGTGLTGLETELAVAVGARDAVAAERDALTTERDTFAAEREALQIALEECRARLEAPPHDATVGLPAELRIGSIATLRQLGPAAATDARTLEANLADRLPEQIAVSQIAMLVEVRYDPVLWASLVTLSGDRARIPEFLALLARRPLDRIDTGSYVAETGAQLGLSGDQIATWRQLAG